MRSTSCNLNARDLSRRSAIAAALAAALLAPGCVTEQPAPRRPTLTDRDRKSVV